MGWIKFWPTAYSTGFKIRNHYLLNALNLNYNDLWSRPPTPTKRGPVRIHFYKKSLSLPNGRCVFFPNHIFSWHVPVSMSTCPLVTSYRVETTSSKWAAQISRTKRSDMSKRALISLSLQPEKLLWVASGNFKTIARIRCVAPILNHSMYIRVICAHFRKLRS